jgi:hypothetical protein
MHGVFSVIYIRAEFNASLFGVFRPLVVEILVFLYSLGLVFKPSSLQFLVSVLFAEDKQYRC